MKGSGYTPERAKEHERQVAWLAADLRDGGYEVEVFEVKGYRPDIRVVGRRAAWIDVKTYEAPHKNIAIAVDEHEEQLRRWLPIVWVWRSTDDLTWRYALPKWLDEHRLRDITAPTPSGSNTTWRLFGPLDDAALLRTSHVARPCVLCGYECAEWERCDGQYMHTPRSCPPARRRLAAA